MQTNHQDTSNELIIQRFGQGIKLIHPEHALKLSGALRIGDLLPMPFHVFFNDLDSVLQKFNERGAATFNINHCNDAIGLTAFDIMNKETANICISHDQIAINKNINIIKDELYTRHDDIDISALTIKFPWYNERNKIIGIFGLSCLLDKKWGTSLADSLSLIHQTGLLQSSHMKQCLPGLSYGEIYFTQRQKEIIIYMIRGKTAKEIATILELSQRTIEHHIENIKLKTNSSSRSELIDKMFDHLIMK